MSLSNIADIALKAVKMVLTEDDFKVPSESARQAVRTATVLVDWATENDDNMKFFTDFFSSLVAKFSKCFLSRRSMKTREEVMWREYHKLRVSDTFRKVWVEFLRQTIGQPASPTFFQFVSHRIFKELVKAKHQLPESVEDQLAESFEDQLEDQASPITKDDENVLRYVCGYVCRKVQAKIQSSSLPLKEEMVLFISDLSGDEWDEAQATEEWTNAIDRGGLWHVSDATYTIFYLMEEEIRKHLIAKCTKNYNDGMKKMILDAVLGNEELLFQWSMLSSSLDDEIGTTILRKMVELYVNIRGFAFASSCLELYKQQHKKKTQKSKALRRKLAAADSTD